MAVYDNSGDPSRKEVMIKVGFHKWWMMAECCKLQSMYMNFCHVDKFLPQRPYR